MTVKRKLPARFNNLLSDNDPKKDDLVELRRLGQTRLMSSKSSPTPAVAAVAPPASPQMTLFSYVHLRAPLPHDINPEIFGNGTKPEAYFLMRRSKDGFVSSTGMFKASFPWASKAEEDAERKYVKSHFNASLEETAGNLWVHPEDALTLSSDYHCRVWIEALVDERQVGIDNRNKAVTPPPPYRPTSRDATSVSSLSPAPSPVSKTRGRTRSKSPVRKIAQPRKSRLSKNPGTDLLKSVSGQIAEESDAPVVTKSESNDDGSYSNGPLDDTLRAIDSASVPQSSDLPEPATEGTSTKLEESQNEPPQLLSGAALVQVATTKETKDNVEIESVKIKVELPLDSPESLVAESPEDMIAKAKEMVAEALKAEGSFDGAPLKKKRKIVDSAETDAAEDVPNISSLDITASPQSKRTKVMKAIKEERFQKTALIGIGATVAIGGLAFFTNLL